MCVGLAHMDRDPPFCSDVGRKGICCRKLTKWPVYLPFQHCVDELER